MARSYTLGEAAGILVEGKDFEAIADLHRRFPLFTHKTMAAMSGDKDAVVEFASYIPEYVSPRKVEKAITSGSPKSAEEDVDTNETAADEPKGEPKKRGRKKTVKVEEPAGETESDDSDDSPYAGKNAMDLFKECKTRKIKAAPKKPAKYYIELLEKDDAAKASEPEPVADDSSDDDDDWDI